MKIIMNIVDIKDSFTLLSTALKDKQEHKNNDIYLDLASGSETELVLRGANTYVAVETKVAAQIEDYKDLTIGLDYLKLLSILNTVPEQNADETPTTVSLTINEPQANLPGSIDVAIDYTVEYAEDVVHHQNITRKFEYGFTSISLLEQMTINEEGEKQAIPIDYMMNLIDCIAPITNIQELVTDQTIGKLSFNDKYAFAKDSQLIGVMPNHISNVFNDISITYNATNIFKSACEYALKNDATTLDIIVNIEKRIITIMYGVHKFNITIYDKATTAADIVKEVKKDYSFTLYRSALQGALRRSALEDQTVILTLKGDNLTIKAGNTFEQVIPVIGNTVEDFVITSTIVMLRDALLGSDNSELLTVYADSPIGNKLYLTITSAKNEWQSVLAYQKLTVA